MPLIEYECKRCGYAVEELKSSAANNLDSFPCPESGCGGTMERIVSGFSTPNMTNKSGSRGGRYETCGTCGEKISEGTTHVDIFLVDFVRKKQA